MHDVVARAKQAGFSWPLPDDLDDATLEQRLYPKPPSAVTRPDPDFKHIHFELGRKGVTLALLWHEYRDAQPDGFGYSQFCARYRQWREQLEPSMRLVHQPITVPAPLDD